MVQTFNPEKVMLADSLGTDIINAGFTQEFLRQLAGQSKVIQLGQSVDMGNQRMRRFTNGAGELSDAYFVGEGEKIGVANVEGSDYVLETRKIAVILPVTEEFLTYTWSRYFSDVVPLIADKFNKMIDGAAFLGLHNNYFGSNVLAQATTAGNVIEGDINATNIIELQTLTDTMPNAFVGNRVLERDLRRLNGNILPEAGQVAETVGYVNPASPTANGSLDGLTYAQLLLANSETYPAGTLITGNFNSLKYGIPNGANLKLTISGDASLSKVQNAEPDTGDVNLFEQDMKALRAVFEIGVAVPNGADFAVLQPDGA